MDEHLENTIHKLEEYYSDKFTSSLESAKVKWPETNESLGCRIPFNEEIEHLTPIYITNQNKILCKCNRNHFFPLSKNYFHSKYWKCPICNNNTTQALGEKYHKLTILELDHLKGYEKYFKCLCDCGNETIVTYNYLKRKNNPIQSCGCLNKTYKDLTNQHFGRLTVLYEAGKTPYGDILWHCKCQCGNEKNIATRSLTSGLTQSCGCYRNEQMAKKIHYRNIQNQKFGLLTAISPILGTNTGNGIKWHCVCECGNTKDITLGNLTSGNVLSCGCLKMSRGEYKISELLDSYNINYIQEWTPETLSFKGRFDFYLYELKYIIEFDGEQHFHPGGVYATPEKFKIIQEHDKIKNQWCKDNNIPIIRIPYTHYNNLCIEDLLLEKSSYILK